MGTEVLRPQDCLGERFRLSPAAFHRRKSTKHGEAGYRKPVFRSERWDQNQKKKFNNQQENFISKKSSRADALKSRINNGPVMGQVTILRRGESLDSLNPKINSSKKMGSAKQSPVDDMVVYGTGRIGPDTPEMVPKQIRLGARPPAAGRGVADIYAGSAFSMSPSPRSLPVPSFFNNKTQNSASKVFDDSATRDLRRLLRLE
ncbi:uncharacterized protein LOC111366023 [Olea europaea var. sylvestris]|uniref:Uncharacterized protein n=1 Tax=Olea europaea subsp. europaea TaxID=158383 RepID=A0A8S0Q2G4_OLEEU|nr:uncharacterized protein LOC111366023 [Olea europaea var. sylvestris]CAA2961060.1 Hypothetical predicted protein [Olea europaea subsp. europaea]